jgi:hypothetical protein
LSSNISFKWPSARRIAKDHRRRGAAQLGGQEALVKRFALLVTLVLAGAGSAQAICVKEANRTEEQRLREARYVFVAMIESSEIETPRNELRGGRWYSVKYRFSMVRSLKGQPADIPFLVTSGLYNDPAKARYGVFAEQSRFVPGDSVLVVASEPGPVPISWIGCGASRPWDSAARQLAKKVFPEAF